MTTRHHSPSETIGYAGLQDPQDKGLNSSPLSLFLATQTGLQVQVTACFLSPFASSFSPGNTILSLLLQRGTPMGYNGPVGGRGITNQSINQLGK